MLRLTCKIQIGRFFFDFVNELEIESSWDKFTDTAVIKLPHKLEFNGEPLISGENALFKRGDEIKILLGYDNNLKTEFEGFVSDVNPATPMIIMAEDLMWKLKQIEITRSYRSVTLKNLLTDILPAGTKFEAIDVNLGKFRITRANVVEVLEEIKKTYGLVSFVRDGVLYAGLAYQPDLRRSKQLDLNHEVVDSNQLVFKRKDDVKIKIKAISIQSNNTRLEAEAGDKEGGQRTLTFYNLTQADLQATANREVNKYKFDGYRGSLTCFGFPEIRHQDSVRITDPKIPERAGEYLVKSVRTTFGVNGFRRDVSLDRKIA